jgi:protein PsiE
MTTPRSSPPPGSETDLDAHTAQALRARQLQAETHTHLPADQFPIKTWPGTFSPGAKLSTIAARVDACERTPMDVKRAIEITEKIFLVLIAAFTVVAMGQEVMMLVENRKVELKDLLLMFIYAEVLGMLGAFYSSRRIPIAIPLFIAVTALSRLIILQGKDTDPSVLLYESGAILLICVAGWVVTRIPQDE